MPAKVLDGRYKLIKQIGAGGFGNTFIARDMRRPGSPPCVVKQLKPASDDASFIREARRLFNTEAETLEKLGKHDQIPQLLAYFEEDTQFYLVQEFIEGRSLHDELKSNALEKQELAQETENETTENILEQIENLDAPIRDQQIGEVEVIKILKDVLDVLEFVHSEGVIHRDIKPDNLIRRRQDQKIVLIDFGAVKAMKDANAKIVSDGKDELGGESRFTVTIGTPGYMPSEQCAGRPTFSSDIYALGMVAIKALTGYAPTDLPTDAATGELVWRDKAQVSNGLAMVLTRMVRYHYTQRYQSVREVRQGINTFATMTEVERQATTSKIMRSQGATVVGGKLAISNSANRLDKDDDRINAKHRRVVSSAAPSTNSGVLFLFGGLLAVVAVVAAFAIPTMTRRQPQVVVTSQPILLNPPTNPTPTATPSIPAVVPANQAVSLEANGDAFIIPNKIINNAEHSYVVQARAGQTLSAAVTGNGLSMTILNAQGIALPDGVNVINANLAIATDGAYTIQLRTLTNSPESSYQLRLGLKDNATSPPPNPVPTSSPPPFGSPATPIATPSANPNSTPSPTPSPTPTAATPRIEIKIRNR